VGGGGGGGGGGGAGRGWWSKPPPPPPPWPFVTGTGEVRIMHECRMNGIMPIRVLLHEWLYTAGIGLLHSYRRFARMPHA
jgi:hypothetical protein